VQPSLPLSPFREHGGQAMSGASSKTLEPDLISIPQAAERLGLHHDTLYRLARTGQFPPAVQIGAKWLVSVPRLERFLHGEASG